MLALGACDTLSGTGTTPHIPIVAATGSDGRTIYTTRDEIDALPRFWSAENLRETVFTGDTGSRIAGRERSEPSGRLNLSRVNVGPEGARQGRGEFYAEVAGEEVLIEPLPQQPILGGQWQNPLQQSGGNVALNYNDAPLDEVVRDILGGILGVNYIVGDDVTGTLTFRSERRFRQTELIQVLADVLARNGYLIQYFNGVYHVGTPEEMETLTGLRGRTSLEGDSNHVINLRGTPPENLVEVVNALIPPGNTVAGIDGTPNLLVRGDPSQFASIEGLVRSLVDSGRGVQALAIIPVRRAPPEAVAEQVAQVYAERGLADVTIVPVETAPGILVVANSRQTIRQIADLVRQLDVENRDTPQVRIIQLNHANARELAERLNQIVGSGSLVPPSGGEDPDQQSNIIAAAIESANQGEQQRAVQTDGGDGISAPRFIRGADTPSQPAAAGGTARSRGTPRGTGEQITFAADERNNAILVRSNFIEFQRIQEVVRALDVAQAQVVIEATIVEVDINDSLQYGVQLFLQSQGIDLRSSTGPGSSVDPGGAGFVGLLSGALGGNQIQAVISALQSVTNVQVISTPYLTVVDGATSRLNVGDQIPFVIASQTSQSGGTVTVTQEVDTRDVGVILNVTPHISPNNTVTLEIVQEVSSARVAETVAGQNPVISQRRVQSQIVVQSGGTALLGGLIQERSDNGENGVPVLRRIPVVGDLFNRTSNTMSRTELLVLITPRVVRNSDTLEGLTRAVRLSTIRN